ncbi:Hsp70 family protein [Micromonospora endolithica]|uniref:Hsp70 family protein n=1 Tax=Micromonospora endolithica TaxID=230091 RepID=A0A3A9ZFS9_9ACTN|nr:Hsp70 family protein [Micromonospora endolithica]RKN46156.1 Hsp70 family protein [Micromonospora endolithica]TWJ25139.1 Hsp70 protein [Micromonospora endolithica]
MQSGEARLAIDWGGASTTGVLAWPDGSWSPLRFGADPSLSSAVFLSVDGSVVTGQDAWRAAVAEPGRFFPAPRRSVEQQTPVSSGEVEGLDLVAATLRKVAEQARSVVGGEVGDVRLVVPAGWGPRRRTWLRHAAHRAGLPQPRLVEAPVAVASYLLASGVQVPVGSYLVVCDVGGGAEASVLRRGPAGFEVLSTLSDSAAGGFAVDDALTGLLSEGEAGGEAVDGSRWALLASVRVAKHALGEQPAVTVPLPGRPAVVANGILLEQAVRPVVERVAELTVEAIAAAEVDQTTIAGLYCVGGMAGMPAVAQALADRVGVAPVVLADPVLAAACGAADAGAASVAGDAEVMESPVPPVRRAVAIAVPGFASLGLVGQFLLTAEWNGASVYRWALLNWGELAMAAVFALVAALGAGTVIASALAARPGEAPMSAGGQVGTGILASMSLGVTVAGLYAVVGSVYIGQEVGAFLRWALLPIVPVVVAAVMAVVAARQWRAPLGGWSRLLAFPTGSVVTAAVGMALIQYSLTADRWPALVLWIDVSGRLGGVLLGVGVAMAVVSRPLLRLILAAPLGVISAAIVGQAASGMLGVIYAAAVGVWWARQVWTRVIRPARAVVRQP